ncbi:hypothetical protein X942_6691 [Burkholderia pseudomallei MSHR5596]|nr:hypothetical protein X990_6145 [Burkholderia pseudomallei MSHR4868]KGS86713.1 hypothetical protein X942_6691 [Burkholderia pseudomallei MSHR5596]
MIALRDLVDRALHGQDLFAHVVDQPAKHQPELIDRAQRHADFVDAIHVDAPAARPGRDVERLPAQRAQRARDLRVEPPRGERRAAERRARELCERRARHAGRPGSADDRRRQRDDRQMDARAHRHRLQQRARTQQPGAHDQPFVKAPAARAALAKIAIERVGGGGLGARGLRAHRHVALRLPAANHRHRVRAHPVVIAVLAAVLDERGPRLAAL